MLFWAIRACKCSRYIGKIYVSTEDREIAAVAVASGAKVIDRPRELADHTTYKQDAIIHAVRSLADQPDLVVSLQPNSPQVRAEDMDQAIEKLLSNGRNEFFSVDANLLQNGAFRIMRHDYVFEKALSTNCGVFLTDYIDLHTLEDVEYLERNSHPPNHYGIATDAA